MIPVFLYNVITGLIFDSQDTCKTGNFKYFFDRRLYMGQAEGTACSVDLLLKGKQRTKTCGTDIGKVFKIHFQMCILIGHFFESFLGRWGSGGIQPSFQYEFYMIRCFLISLIVIGFSLCIFILTF